MPFDIAPGLRITVKGYHVLHRQEKQRTCYVWMEGETPQLAAGETTKLDADARIVEKSEVKKAYKFGGEYVYFKPDELKALKHFGEPCLRIIGFKDRSLLPTWASVKKSTFIFPSEEDYVGSTRVFSALWQKMLKDKKMALAWHISRSNANPILVAILASRSTDDEKTGTPYLPGGLWLYPLPFADDLRNVDLPVTTRCSDRVIDMMRQIVQNLQLPKAIYNPTKYPNPSLQWHYRILQAMALEEEEPEALDDPTIPKYKAIAKRVGGHIEDWSEAVAAEAKNLMGVRSVKRKMEEEDDDDQPAKRTKTAPKPKAGSQKLAGAMSNAQLKLAVESDTLKKMTVAELKDVLASKGVSTAGKKAELLEKLEQWVEENV
jgi:ATP-dependent DNA helicase 2 subunit 1